MQLGNHGSPAYSSGVQASPQLELCAAFSPTELLGRASIGPLSESDEEDDDHKREAAVAGGGQKFVFERDCTELDLNLIEEN